MSVEISSAPDFVQITSIQTSNDFHQVSDQEEIVRDFINWSIRNEIAHNACLFFLFFVCLLILCFLSSCFLKQKTPIIINDKNIDVSDASDEEIIVEKVRCLNKQKKMLLAAALARFSRIECIESFIKKLPNRKSVIFAMSFLFCIEKRQYGIKQFSELFVHRLEAVLEVTGE